MSITHTVHKQRRNVRRRTRRDRMSEVGASSAAVLGLIKSLDAAQRSGSIFTPT